MVPPKQETERFLRYGYFIATILFLFISLHLQMKTGQGLTSTVIMKQLPVTETTVTEITALPGTLSLPYNPSAGNYERENMPYVSVVKEEIFKRPDQTPATPNFFEILKQKDCLPQSDKCFQCLRPSKKGGGDKSRYRGNCDACREACPCFCSALCHEKVEPKFVSKQLTVTLPSQTRDPNRLIPRIVHQTWYEQIDGKKYPNKSRLVQSFRSSGWQHKFYTDVESASFLDTHFPKEVREAYDTILPGAFKADLFRYCVLLIYGGVYADVDILLESFLDVSVGPDVGFMVPFDQPGRDVGKGMCVWNGFIAAAPGHPFLAKAIETVVNQVRNRFTSVDFDQKFCPNPETTLIHRFAPLFTAGPCRLGASINQVLQRDLHTQFDAGDIQMPITLADDGKQMSVNIPGRTVILHQNKEDMGGQRFTRRDLNLIVAATDMPDSSDSDRAKTKKGHYGKTNSYQQRIFGLEKVYRDNEQANEDIRIILVK